MSNNITNTGIFLKQSEIDLMCKKGFPARGGCEQSVNPPTLYQT